MNITILGAGNIGTLVAGELTKRGNKVTIYTRDKSRWKDEITVYDKDTELEYKYKPYKITEDIKEAVCDANIIFVILPAFAIKDVINKAEKYIKKDTLVGFYPGTGGVEFVSKDLIAKGCTIFGTQRVCSVVRLKKYGEYVVTAGKRKEMFLATIPHDKAQEVSKLFEELFEVKTYPLPNYLSVTLTPSNPILHPSRLYNIYKDYKKGKVYDKIPLFYEDWTDNSSKLLIACDEELHNILKKINLDTKDVKPLLEHYESTNYKEMTNKIHSIQSFKGITSPYVEVENGFIPDLDNRYFTADIPYGLVIIKAFALICNVITPSIDMVLEWYQNIMNKEYIDLNNGKLGKDSKDLNLPQLYDIETIEDIENYYSKR